MRVIAVTGGIATGKSSFCSALRDLLPAATVFDADQSVARLYHQPRIRTAVTAALGPRAFTADGSPDRRFLLRQLLADPAAKRRLEAILHPEVLRDCLASRHQAATTGASPLFVAEVPLLFECAFDCGQELAVVVATTPANQALWLRRRSGFDQATIRSLLAAQLPLTEKIQRADVVAWNAGPPPTLRRQAQLLLHSLSLA